MVFKLLSNNLTLDRTFIILIKYTIKFNDLNVIFNLLLSIIINIDEEIKDEYK